MDEASRVEPRDVVDMVERYVDKAHRDAAKYSNSELLDDSGVWSLHKLAAEIYAAGYRDGETAESVKQNSARLRKKDLESQGER